MNRKAIKKVKGSRAVDGAGVSLVRVLGNNTARDFDPILMLDSFDSVNPEDYTAGFPMHPHRGIETISYVYKGKMVHNDSIGNSDTITDGEVQWMNSGDGIMHEEMVSAADRLLGVQLWLNLPKAEKMSKPTYNSIKKDKIEEIPIDGGKIRLVAGEYKDHVGYKGDHLPLNYYDIHLQKDKTITIDTKKDSSLMLFTLVGEIELEGEVIGEKTAEKLSDGDKLVIKSLSNTA